MRSALVILVLSLPGAGQDAPAEPCDDYTFCRRVTLDLTGRLPSPDEIRAFVKSKDRDRKVEELLASPEASLYHADLWMQWLIDHDFEVGDFYRMKVGEFHAWLRGTFDRPLGETVRALITREGPAAHFARKHLAGNDPPVKLALLNARLFLGRDIRCAQCHDHPSQSLTQEEFWGFVAFFGRGSGGLKDHLGEIRSEPRYFDGRGAGPDPLTSLAEYVDGRPAVAERAWKLFMGRGGHPRALEEARTPRDLARAIVATPEYRARRGPLKLMNSVQFMHAFAQVFDLEKVHRDMFEKAVRNPQTMYIFKDEQVMRLYFHKWAKEMILPKGQNPEDVQAHGTVRLALKLMNNAKLHHYFYSDWGLLRRVLAKKSRPADRLEELFLSVIGRPPSREERGLFAVKDNASYEDIFWALVNCAEFLFVS
jgi:hypothetical protein